MQEKIVTPNFLGKLFGSIDRLAVVEQHLIIDQGHSEQRILKYSDITDIPQVKRGVRGNNLNIKTSTHQCSQPAARQPSSQPASLPTRQPSIQLDIQTSSRASNQPASHSANLASRLANQPSNQPASQSAVEPASQIASRPASTQPSSH